MKDKIITIRISKADYKILKKEADNFRIGLSGVIRMKLAKVMGREAQTV